MNTMKKLTSVLLLAIVLACFMPVFAAVSGVSIPAACVHAEENGWNQDSKGWYYLKNGKRLTGLQKINGVKYYFNSSGYRQSGIVKIGKWSYYFRSNGALLTGYSGLMKLEDDGSAYCYFKSTKNGIIAADSWIRINGKLYYAASDGRITFGSQTIRGKLYHITKSGLLTRSGNTVRKSSLDGKYYYPGSGHVLKTGLQKVNGTLYYFSTKTGERLTGSVTIGTKSYYFSSDTGAAKTGWVKSSGKYYYYKNGKLQTGLQTINGKKYYLDPSTGARATNKWVKYQNRYLLYFGSDGAAKTGFFTVNNKTYYANPTTCYRRTGLITINGYKYYLPKYAGGAMYTGWKTLNKKTYYFNTTKSSSLYGAAKTGMVKISGYWYYFNSNGVMQTGWLVKDGKKYYFDTSTGKMVTGTKTIDGTTYDFGTKGWIEVTGTWRVEVNRKECFIVVYRGSTAIKAFVCSTARDGTSTPTGTFSILDKYYWWELQGPTWGQYCSHITSNILFHSVPNTSYNDPYSLETAEYNKLGSPASAGCIRLSVKHAKWMFENVPIGTKVYVSDTVSKPTTCEIETVPKQDLSKSYDPTDTFVNPYSVR